MIQWLMSHPFFEVLSSKMPVLPSSFDLQGRWKVFRT